MGDSWFDGAWPKPFGRLRAGFGEGTTANGGRRSRMGSRLRVNEGRLGRNGRKRGTTAMAAWRAANQERAADARRRSRGRRMGEAGT